MAGEVGTLSNKVREKIAAEIDDIEIRDNAVRQEADGFH